MTSFDLRFYAITFETITPEADVLPLSSTIPSNSSSTSITLVVYSNHGMLLDIMPKHPQIAPVISVLHQVSVNQKARLNGWIARDDNNNILRDFAGPAIVGTHQLGTSSGSYRLPLSFSNSTWSPFPPSPINAAGC